MQTRARAHQHDAAAAALRLHVVHRQRRGVDHAGQVHVQGCRGRGQQLARGISLEGEVVGTGSDACVGEDEVNLAVGVDRGLEQLGERGPLRDVGLDEGGGARGRGRVDVCADDLCAQGAEEFDCCEANARGAACEGQFEFAGRKNDVRSWKLPVTITTLPSNLDLERSASVIWNSAIFAFRKMILYKVCLEFGGQYSLRGNAPPDIAETPLTACGAGGSLGQRHATFTPTIPTHMLPEEGRDAHARYACRVQARRVEHGVQSDHMERLVGGAPPKWALESSRLLVRGPSKRAIVKLPTTVQYNSSVHMHRVLLRRDRVGGGERPALVARQS